MSIEHIRPLETAKQGNVDILFLNVPASFDKNIQNDDRSPPFGLLRAAVVSEKHGFRPAILDVNKSKLNISNIESVLHEFKPRSVGINPTSVNVSQAQEVAELCSSKQIPFVVGGVHATLDPIGALKNDFPYALAVVKGKGESAVLQILDDLRKKKESECNGVYYQNSDIKRTDFGDYYPLDEIPQIDQARWNENPLFKKIIYIENTAIELNEVGLFETLGCPFQCTFCATPVIVDRKQRGQTYFRPKMDKIIEDVKQSINIGANAVHFYDDMVFIKPENFYEFAEGISGLSINNEFYWRGMTRAPIINNCSDQDLKVLVDSGCWRITMGIESGDETMLKQIKKGITKQQVREAVIKLKKAGIPQIKGFFIMGFPNETIEQLMATHDFIIELKQLGMTNINIFQFKPYPGTEEWIKLKKTNPSILENLSYSQSSTIGAKDSILHDDIMIASVPSRTIRKIIEETTSEFYSI